ncbi:MAG TPA: right-handed parallel beta-helix repeat-containing protein [Planctomycetota bacterium]|nr:right-handed parallel beta-helix repeat-containing protein [Planctomycetota bacterium]
MSTTTSAPRASTSRSALLAAALLAGAARATVLHVPADIPTIAEAVAAAQSGDTIRLAAGSYSEQVLISSKIGLTLRGQGKVVLTGGTFVQAALTIQDSEDIVVDHLRIEGALGNGVFAADGGDMTLRRLRVTGSAADGIQAGEAGGVLIDHCLVEGAGGDGIEISFANQSTVTHCTVKDAAQAGIQFSDVSDSSVEFCHVSGSGGQGISIGLNDTATSCTARKNVVLDAGTQGLSAHGPDNLLIDNHVQDATFAGIEVQASSAGTLVQHNVVIGSQTGLRCLSASVVLKDNRATKPTGKGLVIDGNEDVLLDNRVIHAGESGYVLVNGFASGSVLGCKALHAAEDGFEVATDGLLITGNLATGCGFRGFKVEGTGNLFTGNTAHGNADNDLEDQVGGNIYLDNDFGTVFLSQ